MEYIIDVCLACGLVTEVDKDLLVCDDCLEATDVSQWYACITEAERGE
jgi:hypothetical protein